MEEQLSKLTAYGMLIDAQGYLRKQEGTAYAISLLRQAEDKLRVELWTRRGKFGGK